jgi:hypothetical protein
MTESFLSHIIKLARQTEGGHLSIGRGGATFYYTRPGYGRCSYEGGNAEDWKAAAIEAGLPVIDSRNADFLEVAKLVTKGPMIAVAQQPERPPFHSFSYAPLKHVAESYRAIGAEVYNI